MLINDGHNSQPDYLVGFTDQYISQGHNQQSGGGDSNKNSAWLRQTP